MLASGRTADAKSLQGRYELLHRIGVGGMGEVFLARQRGPAGFDRLVALKLLLPQMSDQPDIVSLFVDEARISASLVHPNIVHVYEFGRYDGGYFLAMEYVPGPNLSLLCRRAEQRGVAIPRPAAAQIVAGVARALSFAHQATDGQGRPLQLVHRDVSPHNVLISRHGDIKLMDFGVAKGANRVSRTETGVVRGKFAYMAPEQAESKPVDARADVFSAGVMLWELSLMRPLFSASHVVEALRQLREEEIPRPSQLEHNYPPALERAVMGALERDPTRRTPSADALLAEIGVYLDSVPQVARDEMGQLVSALFPDLERAEQSEPTGTNAATAARKGTEILGSALPVDADPKQVIPPPLLAHSPAGIEPSERPQRPRLSAVAIGTSVVIGLLLGGGLWWWLSARIDDEQILVAQGGDRLPATYPQDAERRQPSLVTAEHLGLRDAAVDASSAAAVAPLPRAKPRPHRISHRISRRAQRRRRSPRRVRMPTPVEEAPPTAPVEPPPQAKLVVAAKPWAVVKVDGTNHGQTDLQLELPPGQHRLELTLSGTGKVVSQTITLVGGRKTKCRASVDKLSCDSPQ